MHDRQSRRIGQIHLLIRVLFQQRQHGGRLPGQVERQDDLSGVNHLDDRRGLSGHRGRLGDGLGTGMKGRSQAGDGLAGPAMMVVVAIERGRLIEHVVCREEDLQRAVVPQLTLIGEQQVQIGEDVVASRCRRRQNERVLGSKRQ